MPFIKNDPRLIGNKWGHRFKKGNTYGFVKGDKRNMGKNNSRWSDTKLAGWQRAKKLYPIEPCEECLIPKKGRIHRHHKDGNKLNNKKSNIQFLCASHHAKAEIALGVKYGRPKKI